MIFQRTAKAIKISRYLTEELYFDENTCSLISSMGSIEAYDAKYGRTYENSFNITTGYNMDSRPSREAFKEHYFPLTKNNIVIFQVLKNLEKEIIEIRKESSWAKTIPTIYFHNNDLKNLISLISSEKTVIANYNNELYYVIKKDESNRKQKWFILSNEEKEFSCNIDNFYYIDEFNSIEEYNNYIIETNKINENLLHSFNITKEINEQRKKSITQYALNLFKSLEKELFTNKTGLNDKIKIIEAQKEVELNIVLGELIFDINPDLSAKNQIIELMISKEFLRDFSKDFLNNWELTKDSFEHFCWKKNLKFSYHDLIENAIGLKLNSKGNCYLLEFLEACCNIQKLRKVVIDFFESI